MRETYDENDVKGCKTEARLCPQSSFRHVSCEITHNFSMIRLLIGLIEVTA